MIHSGGLTPLGRVKGNCANAQAMIMRAAMTTAVTAATTALLDLAVVVGAEVVVVVFAAVVVAFVVVTVVVLVFVMVVVLVTVVVLVVVAVAVAVVNAVANATERMSLLPLSKMNTVVKLVAMPIGAFRTADVYTPLVAVAWFVRPPLTDALAAPVMEVQTPVHVHFRSLLLPESATYTLPAWSVRTSAGALNEFDAAVALSVEPLVVVPAAGPAKMVTAPDEVLSSFSLLLPLSATTM